MKEVAYSKSALKVLRSIPNNEAQRIMAKVQQYAHDPQSQGNNVKALAGSPFIRLRVGDWRIIMNDQDNVLEVHKIGPRGDIYG